MGWTGKTCPACKGTGRWFSKALDEETRCPGCGGTGEEYVRDEEEIPLLHPGDKLVLVDGLGRTVLPIQEMIDGLNAYGWRFHRIEQLPEGKWVVILTHRQQGSNAFGGDSLYEALRSPYSVLTGEWASVPYEKVFALLWALARLTEALEDYHG